MVGFEFQLYEILRTQTVKLYVLYYCIVDITNLTLWWEAASVV